MLKFGSFALHFHPLIPDSFKTYLNAKRLLSSRTEAINDKYYNGIYEKEFTLVLIVLHVSPADSLLFAVFRLANLRSCLRMPRRVR